MEWFEQAKELEELHLWESMGLTGKRALIVHHDDLGITAATNQAYLELGLPTGSILMPGAWAPHLREGDLGVHLTLTSEWKAPRIRPLSGGMSLRDPEGYLWATNEFAWAHVTAEDAEAELRAQIEAFRALGSEPTHIDTHMGSMLRPDLTAIYHKLALHYRLPCFLADPTDLKIPDQIKEAITAIISEGPIPAVRMVDGYPVPAGQRRDFYMDKLSKLGPGVYHFIHHAQADTPEGRMLPDWEGRKADLDALKHPDMRRVLAEFVPLTYRDVKDALRRYL